MLFPVPSPTSLKVFSRSLPISTSVHFICHASAQYTQIFPTDTILHDSGSAAISRSIFSGEIGKMSSCISLFGKNFSMLLRNAEICWADALVPFVFFPPRM